MTANKTAGHVYDCAIFDLDGTLLDTSEGLIEAVQYTINAAGLVQPTLSELRSFIGPPIQDSFERICECSRAEALRLANIFREHYRTTTLLKATPYDGVYEMLDALKRAGFRLAIATYKREDYVKDLTGHFDLTRQFDYCFGSDIDGKLTKTDLILSCVNSLSGGNPTKCVMVGDTVHDFIGAQAAGIDFIAVTYGFGFVRDTIINDHAICYVDSPAAIADLLL